MMQKFRRSIATQARRFSRATEGSVSLEAMLVAPALIISIMFVYTYFGAFEAKADANKANYTISDYLSRQTDTIDAGFLDGLGELYRFLNNEGDVDLRFTAVKYVEQLDGTGDYELVWSYGIGDLSALTNASMSKVEPRLPIMSDGEEVLVVETSRAWSPYYRVGLSNLEFADIVTTKPRFASQVVFDDGTTTTNTSTHLDTNDTDVDTDGSQSGTNTSGGHHGGGRHGGGGRHRYR